MKRKMIVFLILILLMWTSVGFCWVQSFRSAASGNLFYGDFDNDLDPIFILNNNGYRLYTTLSNLSTSNDRFFDNAGEGIYLFSASGTFGIPHPKNWKSRTMFLVQLADERSDNSSGLDTDFNGTIDLPGNGFMSGNLTQYFETNGDNIFDTRVDINSTSDNYDLIKRRDWHITHAYTIGDYRVGAFYSHTKFGDNLNENNRSRGLFAHVTPSHNFSYSENLVQIDLSTGNILERRTEAGNFRTELENPADIVGLSLAFPVYLLANSELRFDLIYSHVTDGYKVNDSFDYMRDVSGNSIVDLNSRNESVTVDSSLGGHLFNPGVLLTENWSSAVYSWFRVDLGIGKFDANRYFENNFNSEFRLTDSNGNVSVTAQDFNNIDDKIGDTKRTILRFYHKTVVQFSERFSFAAGLDLNWQKDNTSWDQQFSQINVSSLDNGNAIADSGDFVSTLTNAFTAGVDHEKKTTEILLPVALEYTLGRWTFRLGAVHTITHVTDDENLRINTSSPQINRVIRGNGDSTVTVSNSAFLSHRNAQESRQYSNNFLYGLQFRATDNITAELLAFLNSHDPQAPDTDFLNTRFFKELRLSLTVKF